MIEIVGSIPLNDLQELFDDLCMYKDDGLYVYKKWESSLKSKMFELINKLGYYDFNSSWFTKKVHQDSTASNWHYDKGNTSSHDYTIAYPTPTEFMLREDVFRPQLGEVVRCNLATVKHRTPLDAYGQPRLLIRLSKLASPFSNEHSAYE